MTLIILSWVGLFTIPKVRRYLITYLFLIASAERCIAMVLPIYFPLDFQIYLNNKAQIDPVLDQVKGKLDEVSEKVFAMIPKGKAAAEKKEE